MNTGLLHLTRVAGATDDDETFAEVEQNERLAARAIDLRDGLEVGAVQHREPRREILQYSILELARNMLRANRLCHACWVTTRTRRR